MGLDTRRRIFDPERLETGLELVEIHVEPYPSPVSYKGEYHYRSGSTKQELKGPALERFLLKKRGRHWDDAPEPSFAARSCSAAALRLFKRRATGHLVLSTNRVEEARDLRRGSGVRSNRGVRIEAAMRSPLSRHYEGRRRKVANPATLQYPHPLIRLQL